VRIKISGEEAFYNLRVLRVKGQSKKVKRMKRRIK